MRKLAFILPSVVLGLYACANADSGDLSDDDPGSIPATKDAGTDATTGRKDGGGTASPPKDSGASSSGDAGRKDGGASSSSGGSSSGGSSSSSSSGGGSGSTAPACTAGNFVDISFNDIQPTEADSCDECPGSGNRCCVDGMGVVPSQCYQL